MKLLMILSTFLLLVFDPALGTAQTEKVGAAPSLSLGDVARQQRVDRVKLHPKPAKVFTNDNLPARLPGEGMTAAVGIAPAPPSLVEPTPAGGASGSAHDEKYFRAKAAQIRARMETHQRQLDVLQKKLSQNQFQYYSDPNKTLLQEYNRGYINKMSGEIEKKNNEIAEDQKALDDLRDELRREGGEPGWLR